MTAMIAGSQTTHAWPGGIRSRCWRAMCDPAPVMTGRSLPGWRGRDPAQHGAPQALSGIEPKPAHEQGAHLCTVTPVQLEHHEGRAGANETGIAGDGPGEPAGGERRVAAPERL